MVTTSWIWFLSLLRYGTMFTQYSKETVAFVSSFLSFLDSTKLHSEDIVAYVSPLFHNTVAA